jgi:hypothetical protein
MRVGVDDIVGREEVVNRLPKSFAIRIIALHANKHFDEPLVSVCFHVEDDFGVNYSMTKAFVLVRSDLMNVVVKISNVPASVGRKKERVGGQYQGQYQGQCQGESRRDLHVLTFQNERLEHR